MSFAYGIVATAALILVGLCVVVDKKRDIWLLLLFVSVFVCNFGYYRLSAAPTLDDALVFHRVSYLGSVYLPFFTLMMILRLCGFPRKRSTVAALAVMSTLVLAVTCSPGFLPVYYSSVDIEITNGVTTLVREYGPLHLLYYVYLLGYMAGMLGIAVYAIVKKKIKSFFHIVCLLSIVLCNVIIWLVEQFLPRGFEALSVSYIVTECLILLLYHSMRKKGFMHSEHTAAYRINVLLVLFLLLLANLIRVMAKEAMPVPYIFSHVAVLLIYMGILISWGVSLCYRILNKSIRRYIIALVGLMIFWMLARTLRYTVFLYAPQIGIWCWYAYYIPMILIPQLCLLAVLYVGKPDRYRLPGKWYFIYIPSALLIIGILTNDLHRWAFRFSADIYENWSLYDQWVLYYAAVVWIFSCIAVMLGQLVLNCRIPNTKRVVRMPISILVFGMLYTVLYALDSQLFGFVEMAAVLCFTVVAIWESCVKTGLIQSNTHYESLLSISGMGVTVVDRDYVVHYSSEDAIPLTKTLMKQTEQTTIMKKGGIQISGAPIPGGRVIWQEDVSDLLALLEELKTIRVDLQDSNAVSVQNYQIAKNIRQLMEKNRLHDQLHKQTAHQIDLLNSWLIQFMETADSDEKYQLLRRIVVVGAYLKRRNNLILVNEQEGVISEEEFRLSMEEMIRNLKLAGIDCASSVMCGRDMPSDIAMELFHFCEDIVERAFDGLSFLLIRCFCRGDVFYACIDAVCSKDLTALADEKISVSTTDNDYYTLTLSRKGGGKA